MGLGRMAQRPCHPWPKSPARCCPCRQTRWVEGVEEEEVEQEQEEEEGKELWARAPWSLGTAHRRQ